MQHDDLVGRIITTLEEHPEGLTITELADRLEVHRNSIAKYADVLVASGRIEHRQVGPAKLYRLSSRVPIGSLLDASNDAIIVLNSDQQVVSSNDASEPLIVDGMLALLSDDIKRALKGVRTARDVVLESHVYECLSLPTRLEEGSVGASIMLRDVTDTRALEQRLRMLDRAVASSSCGITIADMREQDEPLVYVNPAFERITGYAAKEVIGRNCRFLQDGADPPERKIIREAIENGTSCTVVIRNFTKDGTPFRNELRLSPVRDEHGNVTHYIGIQTPLPE